MSTNLYELIEVQAGEGCTAPAVGELLPHYIANLLEDTSAEEVEEHLLDCVRCRKFFLMILNTRGRMFGDDNMTEGEDGRTPDAVPGSADLGEEPGEEAPPELRRPNPGPT